MRLLFASIVLTLASPASAQATAEPAAAVLETIRRHFPEEEKAIAEAVGGRAGEAARSAAHAAIDSFFVRHAKTIAAAPGPALVAVEARHAAALRAVGRKDVALCAVAGDRGLFSPEALPAFWAPGLAEYGVALVEAAKAGAAAPTAARQPATREEFNAWLEQAQRIEPDVPLRDMLLDKEIRRRATADHLCRGAAAMHEAVAALPAAQAERIAWLLVTATVARGN